MLRIPGNVTLEKEYVMASLGERTASEGRVVGVATGRYSVEELKETGADWAIDDVTTGFPL